MNHFRHVWARQGVAGLGGANTPGEIREAFGNNNKKNMNGIIEITMPAKASEHIDPALESVAIRNSEALSTVVDVDKLDTAKPLAEVFQPYQITLEKWEVKAASLRVTDISQKTEMAQARLARLELREARIGLEKQRKGLVEHLKARTGKIDLVARTIRTKLETLEESLRESEEFAERYAEKMKSELRATREAELRRFTDSPIVLDLSDLSDVDFAALLQDTRIMAEIKTAEKLKSEAERLAREEQERVDRERIRAENERLKAEAVERAREQEKERREAAKRLADEQAIRLQESNRREAERLAELAKLNRERKDAEDKIRAEHQKMEDAAKAEANRLKLELDARNAAAKAESDRQEAEKKAKDKETKRLAAAPDNAKLRSFVVSLKSLARPRLANSGIESLISVQIDKLIALVESKITNDLI